MDDLLEREVTGKKTISEIYNIFSHDRRSLDNLAHAQNPLSRRIILENYLLCHLEDLGLTISDYENPKLVKPLIEYIQKETGQDYGAGNL